jgi:hypothetical protein
MTEIKAAAIDIQTLQVTQQKNQQDAAAKLQQDQNAADTERQRIKRENRDKELEGQKDALQGQLASATDPTRKAAIQAAIEAIEEQERRNKRDDTLSGQTSDPSSRAATQGLYAGEVAEGSGRLAGEQQRDAEEQQRERERQQKEASRDDGAAIEAMTRGVEATGNKALIDQLHAAISNNLIQPQQKMAILIEMLAEGASKTNDRLTRAESRLDSHDRR